MNIGLLGFPGHYVASPGDGLDVFESGSGEWTIPNGVASFWVLVIGGGGGGGAAPPGTAGSASTVTYGSIVMTANGGGTGGAASGGDINSTGQLGVNGTGGAAGLLGSQYGRGGNHAAGTGGGDGGGAVLARIDTRPGQYRVSYSVGAAGAAGAGGANGGTGLVVFAYQPPSHTV